MLISVVIPVYNKEKYLKDTIYSVLNQTYKNIEVIILNDGSTDNSAEIINLIKKEDNRVEYIEQENQGVALTRNKGIEVSKGDYILFIDADDELLLDAIEKMVNNLIVTNSDIIVANFYWRKNNGNLNENTKLLYEKLSPSILRRTYIKSNMFLTNGRPLASSCNKLYKRAFLKQHQIQFKSNVFAEDRLFNLMCYVNNPTYSFVDDFTYIYNINNESRSRKFDPVFLNQCINLTNMFYLYLKDNSIFKINKDLMYLTVIYDFENILNYYYIHSKSKYSAITKSIILLQEEILFNNLLSLANKEKVLSDTKTRNLFKLKTNLLIKIYLYTPSRLTSLYYLSLKKIKKLRMK